MCLMSESVGARDASQDLASESQVWDDDSLKARLLPKFIYGQCSFLKDNFNLLGPPAQAQGQPQLDKLGGTAATHSMSPLEHQR